MTTVSHGESDRSRAISRGPDSYEFAFLPTPVGSLLVETSPRGLCRVDFVSRTNRLGDPVPRPRGALAETMRELDEYFEGRRRRFDLRLDLDGISEFSRRVLDELALVPYGGVTSYGELAAAAGFPRAARAVGNVMNRNPIAIVLPCHRVIASDGTLGGYGGNLSRKRTLLALEGVSVDEIRSRSPQTSSNL